jgi:predicted metalloprotease with PDZ domain
LASLLEGVGVALHWRARTDDEDKGGKPAEPAPRAQSWLGARVEPQGPDARITHVYDGGAALAAGLAAGDTIVALNGLRVGAKTLEKRIAETAPGTRVEIHAFRRDELLAHSVALGPKPLDTAYLALDPEPDDKALALRRAWLGQERLQPRSLGT